MTYTFDKTQVLYADLHPTEGVLLNLQTKNYYRLNETGQVIWQGITSGKEANAIAKDLSASFDIPEMVALEDVQELINRLTYERLLSSPPIPGPTSSVAQARASKKAKEPL